MTKLSRREFGAAALGAAAVGAIGIEAAVATAQTGAADAALLPVPPQMIPVPKTLSPAATAFMTGAHKRLAAMQAAKAAGQAPARPEGGGNQAALTEYFRKTAERFKGTSETIDLGNGAKLYHFVPDGRTGRRAQVAYMDIHGGGFTSGGGEQCRLLSAGRAADYGVELYAVDYRLLPDHPYPAPLDDCMEAWRIVLKRHKPADLAIGGASAGGNLAAAVLVRAHDEGLPKPAAAVLLTPVIDMLGEGDSRHTNRFLDPILYGSDGGRDYGKGHDQAHPWLSPIYGDFSKGWPPTFLSTGTRDLLLSDTVRTHRALRRAGVTADLLVTEAGGHGGFQGGAPEDTEVLTESLKFLFGVWGIKG